MPSRAKHGLVGFAACAALASAARADRPPLQQDLNRCALRASEHGGRALGGQVRFDLLKRGDGQVYGAYVHGEAGLDDRSFERCVASAMILWSFGVQQPIDYVAPFPLSVTVGNAGFGGPSSASAQGSFGDAQASADVHMPAANERVGPMELNVKAAQETLEVLETASSAERGMALLAVHEYRKARVSFGEALVTNPADSVALRGMAISLAEDGGDLVEARKLAAQAVAAHPRSEAGHEALLRVCLIAKDDRCAFEEWKAANAADDLAPRAYLLRELEPATRAAVARLQGSAGKTARPGSDAGTSTPPATSAAAGDPCAQEQGEERQALCVVKRCLDAGSAEYAKELSRQNAVDYTAGEWRTKVVAAGKLLVTRPIAAKTPSAGASHDALWLVKMGDDLVIQPSNTEARQITLTHNACGARAAPR